MFYLYNRKNYITHLIKDAKFNPEKNFLPVKSDQWFHIYLFCFMTCKPKGGLFKTATHIPYFREALYRGLNSIICKQLKKTYWTEIKQSLFLPNCLLYHVQPVCSPPCDGKNPGVHRFSSPSLQISRATHSLLSMTLFFYKAVSCTQICNRDLWDTEARITADIRLRVTFCSISCPSASDCQNNGGSDATMIKGLK